MLNSQDKRDELRHAGEVVMAQPEVIRDLDANEVLVVAGGVNRQATPVDSIGK